MLIAGLWLGTAMAGPVDQYGFGAAAMGRGQGGLALRDGAASVFRSPASLTRMDNAQLLVGFGLVRTNLDSLPPVYWDTNRDGRIDATDPPLNVSTDYGRADAVQFAIGQPIGDRFGLSLAGWIPTDRLLRIHTFEPALPTYFMYENRAHRYELALGFGWEQIPGLSVGGALNMLAKGRYRIALTFDAAVGAAAPEDEGAGDLVNDLALDVHEMTLELVPSLSPMLSLHWDAGDTLPALEGLTLAGSWRGSTGLPVEVTTDIQADVHVEDVGELAPTVLSIVMPLQIDIFDHYVPEQLSMGAGYEHPDAFRAYVDLTRTKWTGMELNVSNVLAGEIQSPLLVLPDPNVADGNPLTVNLHNTWSVRTGAEVWLPRFLPKDELGSFRAVLRGGWGYEPSPLTSQAGTSRLLDADRMHFGLGLGVEHADPFGLVVGPVSWDSWFQRHVLASGALAAGSATPYQAGAPAEGNAFPIGGGFWAAGLQARIEH